MALITPGSIFSYAGYRNLWLSNLFVTIGASAFPIALAVTVLDAGGTTTTLGLILASRVLSSVILAPVGGVWADRLPRKFVMIGADLYRAALMIGLVFISTPDVPPWALAALVFAMGAGEAFGFPASGAILPSILPSEKLPAGNVLRSLGVRIAQVVGPGIGGFSVAVIGGRMTFAVTAAFFVIGTVLLFRIDEKPRTVVDVQPTFLTDLREGLKTVWDTPWVAACIAMSTLQLMVVLASENVLLPVITRREFHTNTVFAVAAAMFSIGGSISALIAMRYKAKHPGLIAVVIWGFFAFAPLVLAFPESKTFVIVGYLIAGISIGPWEAYWSSAIQREIPQELQGRVFSVDYMGSVGLMPLGMALVGPVTHVFGERPFLIGAIVFHLLVCGLVLLVPGVIDLHTPKKSDSSQGEQLKA
ncbi:MAG TPA: MFS transporter [Candidatus Paceibacterota bacterium]|nr:MFS transporter [Candidatus Paceibacterota bacterium]